MPRLPTDDWPRRCSHTAHAFLAASSSPHLQDQISFVIPSESEESAFDFYFVFRFLPIAVPIHRHLFLFHRHLHRMIGLSIGWKRPPAHIFAIFPRSLSDDFAEVGILARKFRRLSKRKAE